MALNIEIALVRAIAPPHLADAIIGDLHESRATLARTRGDDGALVAYRNDLLRSLLSLLAYGASRTLANNWGFALVSAAVTCALCVATIPLWDHIGLGGAGYHLLRLALIGLVLGCIPRASTLSCLFLLLLIAVSDFMIEARAATNGLHALGQTFTLVLQDGIIMGAMLIALHSIRVMRTLLRPLE